MPVASEARASSDMLLYLVCRETENPSMVVYIKWFPSKVQAAKLIMELIKEGDTYIVSRWSVPVTKENLCGVLNGNVQYDSMDPVLTYRMQDGRIRKKIHPLA